MMLLHYLRTKLDETIMRKFCVLSLLAVSTVMFFVACSGKKYDNTPSDVALTLYTGLTSGDVAAVTENIYFQDSLDYNVFSDYFKMAVASEDYKARTSGFKADYKVVSEKIDGGEATVALEGVGPLGNMLKINVKLLLIDNKWKVDGNHGVFHTEFPEE
ncbi:MAG: DUF4878 domain-containing protein [Bacteroidales bacterium]|nr:DUF4878 domain-containing protein [Bacteroidales bacterium]